MARGFLSGAIMGTVVSVSVAGVASIVADGPAVPVVSDAAPTGVSADAAPNQAGVDAGTGDADLVQDGTRNVTQPTLDDVNAVAVAGSDLSQQPETGGADGLQSPDTVSGGGAVEVDREAPVLPSPQAQEPSLPNIEAELSISTDPAHPPAPEVVEQEIAFEEGTSEGVTAPEAPSAEPAEELVAQVDVPAETPTENLVDEDADVTDIADLELEAIDERSAEEEGADIETPQNAGSEQPQAQTVATEERALPQIGGPKTQGLRPSIGRPAGSLVNRGDTPAEQTEAPQEPDAAQLAPLDAFAVSFDDPGDKPLMSIVLIDEGVDLEGTAVGLPALRSFPAPVSFAVQANLPDAAERMKTYRAEGFEVLAMVDLPTGATAVDVEVGFDAILSDMNEVVGVIEGVGTGLQGGREASDQATQILLSTGHGLVMQSNGLNTVAKLAEREGVPTATVFRDFDSADQTPTVIRRFLDQAAFRAGQETGVIMLGRLRPETISALLLWGLQDRASRVSLAPVSAVLKQ